MAGSFFRRAAFGLPKRSVSPKLHRRDKTSGYAIISGDPKGLAVKPKAILAYCREKGIRSFDLRFATLEGHWQQVTMPISSLSENSFEEGFGHEISWARNSETQTFSVLVPNSHANFFDPFTQKPTLVFVASVLDVVHRQEDSLDSRFVALEAVRYLQSSGIADDARVRATFRFGSEVGDTAEEDTLYQFRSESADYAVDAGINLERHYRHPSGASEMATKSASMVESVDDVMMMRYLISTLARNRSVSIDTRDYWSSSQWNFVRNEESIFPGTAYRGLSELGQYALGGICRHAEALAGIFLMSSPDVRNGVAMPFRISSNPECHETFSRSVHDAQHPRSHAIEVRGTPSTSNLYLSFAATVMAMIDGIQNKFPPDGSKKSETDFLSASAKSLEDDCDFLMQGGVFDDTLIRTLLSRLG